MKGPAQPKRKWLPVEAYRFLALAALRDRGETGISKRELAWLTRANHYVITRVLGELTQAKHATITTVEGAGYVIRATAAGAEFHERHRDYARETYGASLDAHFRFGRRPEWSRF